MLFFSWHNVTLRLHIVRNLTTILNIYYENNTCSSCCWSPLCLKCSIFGFPIFLDLWRHTWWKLQNLFVWRIFTDSYIFWIYSLRIFSYLWSKRTRGGVRWIELADDKVCYVLWVVFVIYYTFTSRYIRILVYSYWSSANVSSVCYLTLYPIFLYAFG